MYGVLNGELVTTNVNSKFARKLCILNNCLNPFERSNYQKNIPGLNNKTAKWEGLQLKVNLLTSVNVLFVTRTSDQGLFRYICPDAATR